MSAAAGSLFAIVLIAGWPRSASYLRERVTGIAGGSILAGIAAVPAAAHAASARAAGATEILAIFAYAVVPVLLLRPAGVAERARAGDWAALILIWAPAAAGWPLPDEAGDPAAPLIRWLLALALLLVAFVVVRPGLLQGFAWKLRAGDAAAALAALAAILLAAVPASLLAGTAAAAVDLPAPERSGLPAAAWTILAGALCREVVYRGLLFGFLQGAFTSRHGPWPALLLAALASAAEPALVSGVLDPLRIGLAVWAGAWIGWSVLRTGSLMPAIAVHAALETIRRFS